MPVNSNPLLMELCTNTRTPCVWRTTKHRQGEVEWQHRQGEVEWQHRQGEVEWPHRQGEVEWQHRQGSCFACWSCKIHSRLSRDCTDSYYARGSMGVLPMRVEGATNQLDLPSLTPLSVAGCGRLQLGVPHWATSVDNCK